MRSHLLVTVSVLGLGLGCVSPPARVPGGAAPPRRPDTLPITEPTSSPRLEPKPDPIVTPPPQPTARPKSAQDPSSPDDTGMQIMGSLSVTSMAAGSVRKVVQDGAMPKLRNCYVAALSRDPELRGKVIVRFEIAPSGAVSKAEAKSEAPF